MSADLLPPIYDINRSYSENSSEGPFFDYANLPKRDIKDKSEWFDFLGYKVQSRIGVPAGPLLNSKWTSLAADLGFDIVSYKTIRSTETSGHPLPNVLYVQTDGQLPPGKQLELFSTSKFPENLEGLAITNSFGMPSKNEAYLREDIAKAKNHLKEGQILIVSAVGTPSKDSASMGSAERRETFFEDFVKAVKIAREAGADVVEVNFSCPNVTTGEGSIYTNPETASALVSKISSYLTPFKIPLVVKAGAFPEEKRDTLSQLLRGIDGQAQAVCGINTISARVYKPESKEPALGENRCTSGVCGAPIRQAALDFVSMSTGIIKEHSLSLQVIGCGGVTKQEHFKDLLDRGAIGALSATGMMWDPLLASRYHAMQS